MILILDNGADYSDHQIAFIRCASSGEVDLVRAYVKLAAACGDYRNGWRSVLEIEDAAAVKIIDPSFPVSAPAFAADDDRYLDAPDDQAAAEEARKASAELLAVYIVQFPEVSPPWWLKPLHYAATETVARSARASGGGS